MRNVKEWMKDHKQEIGIAAVSIALGAIGGISVYKWSRRDVERMHENAMDAYGKIYPALKGAKRVVSTNFEKTGITDATMGEMGLMIEGLKQHESYNPDRGVTGIAVFLKEKGES